MTSSSISCSISLSTLDAEDYILAFLGCCGKVQGVCTKDQIEVYLPKGRSIVRKVRWIYQWQQSVAAV